MNWISRTGPGLSLAIVLSILLTAQSQAQTSYKYVRKHLERYDEKEIHYAIFLAAPVTPIKVTYSPSLLYKSDAADD